MGDWIGKTEYENVNVGSEYGVGPSYGEAWVARFEKAFSSEFTTGLIRKGRLTAADAQFNDYSPGYDDMSVDLDYWDARSTVEAEADRTNPVQDDKQWSELRYKGKALKDHGLEFRPGHRREYWETLAEIKDTENQNNKIIAASKHSGLAGLSLYSADFAGTALDPMNMAMIAIPFGIGTRFGTRVGMGIVEGLATSIPQEIGIYQMRNEQQLEHTMEQSMLAVGASTAFSVVGRVVGGLFADSVAKRTATKQFNDGKKVDVSPVADDPAVPKRMEKLREVFEEGKASIESRKVALDKLKDRYSKDGFDANFERRTNQIDDIAGVSLSRGIVKDEDTFYNALSKMDMVFVRKQLDDIYTAFVFPPIVTEALGRMKRAITELFRVGAPGTELSKTDIKEMVLAMYERTKDSRAVSNDMKKTLDLWLEEKNKINIDKEQWVKGEDIERPINIAEEAAKREQASADRVHKMLTETSADRINRMREEYDLLNNEFENLRRQGIVPSGNIADIRKNMDEINTAYVRKIELINNTVDCVLQIATGAR